MREFKNGRVRKCENVTKKDVQRGREVSKREIVKEKN